MHIAKTAPTRVNLVSPPRASQHEPSDIQAFSYHVTEITHTISSFSCTTSMSPWAQLYSNWLPLEELCQTAGHLTT